MITPAVVEAFWDELEKVAALTTAPAIEKAIARRLASSHAGGRTRQQLENIYEGLHQRLGRTKARHNPLVEQWQRLRHNPHLSVAMDAHIRQNLARKGDIQRAQEAVLDAFKATAPRR